MSKPIIDAWRIVMTTEDGKLLDLNLDLGQHVTESIDELIEEHYPVTWQE